MQAKLQQDCSAARSSQQQKLQAALRQHAQTVHARQSEAEQLASAQCAQCSMHALLSSSAARQPDADADAEGESSDPVEAVCRQLLPAHQEAVMLLQQLNEACDTVLSDHAARARTLLALRRAAQTTSKMNTTNAASECQTCAKLDASNATLLAELSSVDHAWRIDSYDQSETERESDVRDTTQ